MAIDVEKLKSAGTYQVEAPLSSILSDIEQIGDFLKQIEIKRGNFRKFGGISLGAGLVLAILSGATHVRALSALAFLAFAAGVGLYIYSFVYGRSMHTHHSRYDLLKGLFTILQRDAHPRSSFSVKLALKSQPTKVSEQ